MTQNDEAIKDMLVDIQKIIDHLGNIAMGLERDFENIGNDLCAYKINENCEKFYQVKRQLEQIDTATIEDK